MAFPLPHFRVVVSSVLEIGDSEERIAPSRAALIEASLPRTACTADQLGDESSLAVGFNASLLTALTVKEPKEFLRGVQLRSCLSTDQLITVEL